MAGLTEPFMIPYALALGATSWQAGLLSSARNFLLALVQLGTAEGVRRAGSRRALVVWTASLQAALWVPLIVVAPLFGSWAVPALIGLYTLGTAASALGGPAWGSLMADYLAAEERGRYFGRRAWLVGIATTLAGGAAGLILQATEGHGVLGFSLLCAAACAARVLSCVALSRLADSGWHDDPHLRFSFLDFLRRAPTSNFTRFCLCVGAISFAAHVAAPYFAIYLLEEGKYSYLEYTVVVLAGAVAGMISSPWWGRFGDRYGNHAVLRISTLAMWAMPILWMISLDPLWMLLSNVLGAFLWAGLNLSATNFVYDAVTPARRHTCIAYFNVLNGLGVSGGAFLGAWLVSGALPLELDPFFAAFALSALGRVAAAIGLHRLVREVRAVRQVGLREVMLDLVGQRLVAVLGFLSVRPEVEQGDAEEKPEPPIR
jgi:MFS family permease